MAACLLEEFIIEKLHNGALVRSSQLDRRIEVIQCLSSDALEINEVSYAGGLERLSAAVDAAAGTSHDLNEVILLLAGDYAVNYLSCVSKTGSNTDLDINSADSVVSFLDAGGSSYLSELKCLALAVELNSSCSESCLHNTAGSAEDSACAGCSLERIVELAVRKSVEVNACSLDHSAEFSCCECYIDIVELLRSLLLSCYLKLLCGTRDNADNEDILGIDIVLLSPVALDNSAEHLLR